MRRSRRGGATRRDAGTLARAVRAQRAEVQQSQPAIGVASASLQGFGELRKNRTAVAFWVLNHQRQILEAYEIQS